MARSPQCSTLQTPAGRRGAGARVSTGQHGAARSADLPDGRTCLPAARRRVRPSSSTRTAVSRCRRGDRSGVTRCVHGRGPAHRGQVLWKFLNTPTLKRTGIISVLVCFCFFWKCLFLGAIFFLKSSGKWCSVAVFNTCCSAITDTCRLRGRD